VRVVEDVVPVAQREFFQIRDFGFVDDVLKTDEIKMYLLSIIIDRKTVKVAGRRSRVLERDIGWNTGDSHLPVATWRPG